MTVKIELRGHFRESDRRSMTGESLQLGRPWKQLISRKVAAVSDAGADHIVAVVGSDVVHYRLEANGTFLRAETIFEDGEWSSPDATGPSSDRITAAAIDHNNGLLHIAEFDGRKWTKSSVSDGDKLIGDPLVRLRSDGNDLSIIAYSREDLRAYRKEGGRFAARRIAFEKDIVESASSFYMTNFVQSFLRTPSEVRQYVYSVDGREFRTHARVPYGGSFTANAQLSDICATLVSSGSAKNRIETLFQLGSDLNSYWLEEAAPQWEGQAFAKAAPGSRLSMIDLDGRKLLVVLREGRRLRGFRSAYERGEKSANRKWVESPAFGQAITGEPTLIRKRGRFDGRLYAAAVVQVAGDYIQYFWYDEDVDRWVGARG